MSIRNRTGVEPGEDKLVPKPSLATRDAGALNSSLVTFLAALPSTSEMFRDLLRS